MVFDLGDEVTYAQCLAAATKTHFEGKVRNFNFIDEILVFAVHEEVYVVIDGLVITVSSYFWVLEPFIEDCEERLISHDLSARNGW